MLRGFEHLTGAPVVINTSFTVRCEPIVCAPEGAYRCSANTGMDTWSWGGTGCARKT